MKRIVAVMFLCGTAIAVTGFRAAAAEPPGALTKDEVKTLIRNAKSPEDHMKLASYYRSEAARLQTEVKDHEEMEADYEQNIVAHPVPKAPTLGQHCRNLAKYYSEAAKTANQMAAMHEEMAKKVR